MSLLITYQLPLSFLSPLPLSFFSGPALSRTRKVLVATSVAPIMTLQRPDAEGPPSLEEFLSSRRKAQGDVDQPPVTLGTGRAILSEAEGSLVTAVENAMRKAKGGLAGSIDLVHVTCSPEFGAREMYSALQKQIGEASVMGRVIRRSGKEGILECLVMKSGVEGGVSFEEGSFPPEEVGEGVRSLVRRVIGKMGSIKRTFWVFSCDEGVEEAHIRKIIEEEETGSFAYGGRAIGGSVIGGTDSDGCVVQVAAVSGAVSFLQSAIVKGWTQPA